MINLSLGGLRDPRDPDRDTYSPLEAAAVAYAYGKGVVVVAAVGNAERRRRRAVAVRELPGRAAARPRRQRARPRRLRSRLLEPRQDLQRHRSAGRRNLSTMPRDDDGAVQASASIRATRLRARRVPQGRGHLLRGSAGLRRRRAPPRHASDAHARAGDGAARARPRVDVNAATGCKRCPPRRDAFTGWGRLDVAAALASSAARSRPRDSYEPNDDAGDDAAHLVRPDEADRGDARLLGRPERRLRDPASARPARLRQRSPARPAPSRTSSLAARARQHVDDLRDGRSRSPDNRRSPAAQSALLSRAARRARTTSR